MKIEMSRSHSTGCRVLGMAFLLLCAASTEVCGEMQAASRDRHNLEVRLKLEERTLWGRDEIVFGSPTQGVIVLDLSPRAQVRSVIVGGDKASYTFDSGRLIVSLPLTEDSPPKSLTVSYEAVFDDPVPDDPVSFDNPGFGVTGSLVPQGAFLLAGSGWYPHIQDRQAIIHLEVSAPRGIYAVTAGRLVRHEDQENSSLSLWDIDPPAEGLALSAGPYVIHSSVGGKIPVYTYFFPQTTHLSQRYIEAAVAHIELYESLLGPYPFPKFAIVENFFPTGYGFPSYTLLGTSVLQLPFIPDTSLRHEVAHGWWGNGVLVEGSSGNWCEGLTTYVADYLSQERKSTEEGLKYRHQILQDYAALAASGEDLPLSRFLGRMSPATQAVGYGKAAFVFHMIRQRIGDEPFWQSLRQIYRQRLFRETSWEDFRKAFVESGHWNSNESRRFFDQWVQRSGAPTLELRNVRRTELEGEWRVEGTVSQSSPPYELKIPLHLETTSGVMKQIISLNSGTAHFSFRSSDFPERLIADPDVNVFRRLLPEEMPGTVNRVKGSKELIAVLADSADPLAESIFRLLLTSLNQEAIPIRRETEVKPSALEKRDVIFWGTPQPGTRKLMLPSLPHSLSLSAEGMACDGMSPETSGDTVFAVFTDPARKGHITALFYPVSGTPRESIEAAARKVTHYGKYSLLTFAAGTNVGKTVWATSESPLIETFEENRDERSACTAFRALLPFLAR